jgi:hypothetical protein
VTIRKPKRTGLLNLGSAGLMTALRSRSNGKIFAPDPSNARRTVAIREPARSLA